MSKYYAGTINETNGEYEYDTTYYFQLEDKKTPKAALERIAKHWYGDEGEWDSTEQAWNFNNNWVWAGNVIELPKETYDLMRTL